MRPFFPRRYVATYKCSGPAVRRLNRRRTVWAFSRSGARTQAIKRRPPGASLHGLTRHKLMSAKAKKQTNGKTLAGVGALLLLGPVLYTLSFAGWHVDDSPREQPFYHYKWPHHRAEDDEFIKSGAH